MKNSVTDVLVTKNVIFVEWEETEKWTNFQANVNAKKGLKKWLIQMFVSLVISISESVSCNVLEIL